MPLIGSQQALRLRRDQLLKLRRFFRPNVFFIDEPDGEVDILIAPDDNYNSGRPITLGKPCDPFCAGWPGR